jgi:hypothetical protein
VKAFFLGYRMSILYIPQDLEEDQPIPQSWQCLTEILVREDTTSDETDRECKETLKPVVPNRHPLHGISPAKLPAKKILIFTDLYY